MTQYTATHEGFTFKRKSDRPYTHVVIKRQSIAAHRTQAEQEARVMFGHNLSYYQELANGIHERAQRWPAHFSAEKVQEDINNAKAWVAKGVEGHVADAMARFEERAARQVTTADGDTYYTYEGWCGRPDLAQKLASKTPGSIILPAIAK